MGYYTTYELTVQPIERANEVVDFVENSEDDRLDEFSYALEYVGNGYWGPAESAKWYDYTDDMKWLSRQFPDVLFTLSGSGEDSKDLWTTYFKNGKYQNEDMLITAPPFDESKLQ